MNAFGVAPGLAPAHSPFGGSVAARILRCPASVGLLAKVPEYLRKPSAYADRGSALHVAMARLIEREVSLDGLVGETISDYAITRDDVEDALRPVLAYVDALLDQPGAEYFLEKRVVFPGLRDTFGTADLIVRIGAAIHLLDFKFGSGVRVLALYPDRDEDLINAQLLFYCVGARYSLPKFFAGVEIITLTILQPQSIEPDDEMTSSVAVAHAELDQFEAAYAAAYAEALGPSPRLERGPHCRFCVAKPICPAHTGPLLELARFELPTPATAKARGQSYAEVLAAGLSLADATKDLVTELHDQAKRALEHGDDVPNFALSRGRAVRAWRDENAALSALLDLGFELHDLVDEAPMRSLKQVEIRAKSRGLKVPSELILSRPSGVSLTRAENARPPLPGREEIARSFAAALEAFQGGKQP